MPIQLVLISGTWRNADAAQTFRATNPNTGEALPDEYPISGWADCDAALTAAAGAAIALRELPAERIASFLTRYAERIESRAAEIVDIAHRETALSASPRLSNIELPRTTN